MHGSTCSRSTKPNPFFEGRPYDIAHDFDVESNEHRYRIAGILRELTRHRMAQLAGDCIHNLRSAPDHIVWRLSEDFRGPGRC